MLNYANLYELFTNLMDQNINDINDNLRRLYMFVIKQLVNQLKVDDKENKEDNEDEKDEE
jgi:flagellin-specific chaperone FliS